MEAGDGESNVFRAASGSEQRAKVFRCFQSSINQYLSQVSIYLVSNARLCR